MLTNRKGQFDKKVTVVVTVIISIVVLFQIFASLVPEAQTAGDSLNVSNRCIDSGCFYNTTTATQSGFTGDCSINTSGERTGCTNQLGQGIPLSGIFGSRGIVIVLLMVALFLGALKIVMPKSKK